METWKSLMHNQWRNKWIQTSLAVAISVGLAGTLSGCGKQRYLRASKTESLSGQGDFTLAPKVDILMALDDSGSIIDSYSQVESQVKSFLTGLENQGWDYRFANTPLTQNRPINQVMASRYDGNWPSNLWLPPFPGADQNLADRVARSYFAAPSNYSEFYVTPGNGSNAIEDGFSSVLDALNNRLAPSQFLRDDAILAVIVLSNGEDTSLVKRCTHPNLGQTTCDLAGFTNPCSSLQDYYNPNLQCSTDALSFNHYQSEIQKKKPAGVGAIKFYSSVAGSSWNPGNQFTCMGVAGARNGIRYRRMAQALGGKAYDVCTTGLGSVLADVGVELKNTVLQLRTRYLMIGERPDESSLKVYKISNGQRILLTKGVDWTYVDQIRTVHTIDYPVKMNLRTGYAIELLSTRAVLQGNEKGDVEYHLYGSQNAL